MRKLFFASAALFLVSIFFSSSTLAWDDVGHKITGYIAWQRMTPAAREAVIKILRSAPEDSDLSVFYMAGPEPEATRKMEYFMFVTTWADVVRERTLENRYKKYHHSNWHYDDTFWKQVGNKAEVLPKAEEGGVAVSRLVEYDKVIHDSGASDKDKAIAIAWIMHLIGDLHQPLHTSARVTDTEPKGDQGANLFLLTPQGTPREKQQSLHWFWDSIVVRANPLKGDTCERDYLTSIANSIMKNTPYNSVSSSLGLGGYEKWRAESFAFNPTDVFTPDLVRFKTPSEKYKKHAFDVAQRRLALAGYRIGDTLNSVFGQPPVITPGAK
jgi:hypothetical protein